MLQKMMFVMALVLAPLAGLAAERGTADEAAAMVEHVVTLFDAEGIEAVIAAVGDPSNATFRDRDLYVIVGELGGNLVAHGANSALVGRNLDGMKDANGVLVGVELQKTAREDGAGWVDYVWPNPATKKIESKSTRVVRLGDSHYAGVGIYKD